MRAIYELLRHNRALRWFLAAHAQSSLGTGASYVALVVVAYDRFESPWSISLVLLAEFLPGIALGPLLGAAADRWSRRACAIVADLVRAGAFLALPFVDGVVATVAVAAVAGAGNALFRPAVLAAMPGMVSREHLPAANAAFGALTDIAYTAGPALAALAMLFTGAEIALVANGVTFVLSAAVLARLDFGRAPAQPEDAEKRSLLRSAAEGMRAAAARPGIRILIVAPAAVMLFGGIFNVGELLLAEKELGGGDAAYSILVAIFGGAVALGSLTGSRGGPIPVLLNRYEAGFLLMALGIVAAAFAPSVPVAAVDFAVAGFGNGLILVHERIVLQRVTADAIMARIFSVKETLEAIAFAIAFIAGGAIASALPTRELFLVAGGGALVIWFIVALSLRRAAGRGAFAEVEPDAALEPAGGA